MRAILNAFQLRPIEPDQINLTPKLIRFNHSYLKKLPFPDDFTLFNMALTGRGTSGNVYFHMSLYKIKLRIILR